MARTRKPLKPKTVWRYGAQCDEPLFIQDEVRPGKVREIFVEFVAGAITHQKFAVRIRGEYHYFVYNNFSAHKQVIGDDTWVSRVVYRSLEVMADHVMRAIFSGFGTSNRPSTKPLYVEGERVTLLRLSRGNLTFRWSTEEYRVFALNGEMLFDEPGTPLPPSIRRFFERFAIEIWPKLPVYKTKKQREAELVARRIKKTAPATLLLESEVLSVKIVKKPRAKPKPDGPHQPRLC
ncbi:MAG: hypothetical protein QG636_515 [Patescibacteria group bacterium]|jgi:hypothetical protein|nr:hypothetical protein [Patescibacteria group bacterium]